MDQLSQYHGFPQNMSQNVFIIEQMDLGEMVDQYKLLVQTLKRADMVFSTRHVLDISNMC